jgi:hypothetical protein
MGVVGKILSGVLIGFVVGGGEQKEAKFANGAKPFPATCPRRFLALQHVRRLSKSLILIIRRLGISMDVSKLPLRCVVNSFVVRGRSKAQVLLRSKEFGFGTSNDWVSSTQTW